MILNFDNVILEFHFTKHWMPQTQNPSLHTFAAIVFQFRGQ